MIYEWHDRSLFSITWWKPWCCWGCFLEKSLLKERNFCQEVILLLCWRKCSRAACCNSSSLQEHWDLETLSIPLTFEQEVSVSLKMTTSFRSQLDSYHNLDPETFPVPLKVDKLFSPWGVLSNSHNGYAN